MIPLNVTVELVVQDVPQDVPAPNHADPNKSLKLQDELQKTETKMKQPEDNFKFLKAQKNQLDDSVLDLQDDYKTAITTQLATNGESTIVEEVNGVATIETTAIFEELNGASKDDAATIGASDDVYNISAIRNIISTEMQLFNLTGSVEPSSATQLVIRNFMGQDSREFDYLIQSHGLSEREESAPIPCTNISINRWHKKKHKELNDEEISNCVDDLLHKVNNFKLPKGEITKIAAKYNVSRWTIQRIWKKIKYCLKSNTHVQLKKNKKGVVGRKKGILDDEALRNRRNKRLLAASLVNLGNYVSSGAPKTEDNVASQLRNEEETIEQISKHENSAAGIYYQVKGRYGSHHLNITLFEDVLGVIASLGQVDDDNLSRLLSEFLGLQTMLALVCKTYEGVKALELYDGEGLVNKGSGIIGIGASIGRSLKGRFSVMCLEKLRTYPGGFLSNDPQRRLDIPKPRLPAGDIPTGFLGFAVNMIYVDRPHLFCLTSSGCGLRETLFYSVFSRLQIYRTRAEMLLALPCISDGAISLDGGMIKSSGVFSLGSRENIDVSFPKCSKRENLRDKYSSL